jgi:hypothetical protein
MRKSQHRPVNNDLWLQAFCSRYGHPAVTSQQQVATSNAPALTGHEILALSFDAGLFEPAGHNCSRSVIGNLARKLIPVDTRTVATLVALGQLSRAADLRTGSKAPI